MDCMGREEACYEHRKFILVSGSESGMIIQAAELRSCTGEDARAYITYAACPLAPTGESWVRVQV